jgi:hypothetical protein
VEATTCQRNYNATYRNSPKVKPTKDFTKYKHNNGIKYKDEIILVLINAIMHYPVKLTYG